MGKAKGCGLRPGNNITSIYARTRVKVAPQWKEHVDLASGWVGKG